MKLLSKVVLMLVCTMVSLGNGQFTLPLDRGVTITSGWLYKNGTRHDGPGIDFDVANDTGQGGVDGVVVAAPGEVVHVWDCVPNKDSGQSGCSNTAYGNHIIIKHDNEFETLYAHLYYGSIKVELGDKVVRGQELAKGGNTGTSTGPHLHFEIRKNSISVDPYNIGDLDHDT